ncbi:MAG: hypothetical protein GX938_01590 [Spirochaetales bacterium]|nr:hypothetical protein [Spirochaetales bacterium]
MTSGLQASKIKIVAADTSLVLKNHAIDTIASTIIATVTRVLILTTICEMFNLLFRCVSGVYHKGIGCVEKGEG